MHDEYTDNGIHFSDLACTTEADECEYCGRPIAEGEARACNAMGEIHCAWTYHDNMARKAAEHQPPAYAEMRERMLDIERGALYDRTGGWTA